MKKLIALLLALSFIVLSFSGCEAKINTEPKEIAGTFTLRGVNKEQPIVVACNIEDYNKQCTPYLEIANEGTKKRFEKYTEEYFKENILVAFESTAMHTSCKMFVTDVKVKKGRLIIKVETSNNGVSFDETQRRVTFVELSAKHNITSSSQVDIYVDGEKKDLRENDLKIC